MQLKMAIYSFVFFMGLYGYGQDKELDPVTVTSSLSKQRSSETGRNIIFIKGDQFNQLPVHSLDDLLRYLPGIEVQQRGPMGAQSDILIRGGTFQQVLVILDGIRLNDPLTGHFNAYMPITPSDIDHIEVLKGASSAIYGTEAVGGVIQIITKTFVARQSDIGNSLSGDAGVTTGEYGLINASGGITCRHNGSSVSAGVLTNNADGQPQRGIDGFFHNTTASGSFSQLLNAHWTVSGRSSYDRRNFAAQNFYTAFASDTATEKVSGWWNQVKLAYQKLKNSFSFDAGYKTTEDTYDFSKGSSPNSNHSKLLQGLAVYGHRFSKGSLTLGGQFIRQSIVSNDRGDHGVNNIAGFIIYEQELFPHFHISPAVRTDWNQVYGWEFVPQVNLSYKLLNQFLLRGSAGKTTRNADFTELYNNYNKTVVTSGNIGNPDLKTEHSFSWEAGADYYFSGSLKIAATYFNKDYSQMIDWVNTAYDNMPRKSNLVSTGSYYLARNISSLMTSGVETDIQFHSALSGHQNLFAMIGLVWLHSNSNGQTPSLYISSHANFLFNYSVNYNYKWLQLSVNGLYKRRPEQNGGAGLAALSKDYYMMNAKIGASVIKSKVMIFFQGDNIFNESYADRFGVPMPGRWLMGGIQFKFRR